MYNLSLVASSDRESFVILATAMLFIPNAKAKQNNDRSMWNTISNLFLPQHSFVSKFIFDQHLYMYCSLVCGFCEGSYPHSALLWTNTLA